MNWKALAKQYNLDASANFWAASEEDIETKYNGVGPDNFFPEKMATMLAQYLGQRDVDDLNAKLRGILNKIFWQFEVCAVIHDFDFSQADKSEAGFHAANARLLANCKRVITANYPWWQFWTLEERAEAYALAEAMFYACEKFGKQAWMD